MSIVTFAPATRLGSHIIITAYGVSGCGKTLSLLLLGRGLAGPNGKLGMIDTETGRGRIYASRVPGGYLYGELTPPFTPERYIEAIDDAEKAGVEVLVLDSGSHEWEGFGGVLEIADAGKSLSGNPLEGLVKWAGPKARHKKYVNRLLNSHMHLLIALRAKEKMKQYTAKDAPLPAGVRVGDIISQGFTPIQDKRFIFETTVQLFLPLGPRADLGKPIVEKCPEDLWAAFPEGEQISVKTGELIREWVAGGEPVDKELLTLRRQAEESAGAGVEAFRAHWRKLSKATQNRLTDQLDNLRSIAESADAEKPQVTDPLGGTSISTGVLSDFSVPPRDIGEGPGEAVAAYNLIDADGVPHSYDDPESAFAVMIGILDDARDAHGLPGLLAAWHANQPSLNETFAADDRKGLIDDLNAYFQQECQRFEAPQKPAGEPPAPERPQEPELASPPPAPAAAGRTGDLLASAEPMTPNLLEIIRPKGPDGWSAWRQIFDVRIRKCRDKVELSNLIAANFHHIDDYNRALPRAAGIFAAERDRRMEELSR